MFYSENESAFPCKALNLVWKKEKRQSKWGKGSGTCDPCYLNYYSLILPVPFSNFLSICVRCGLSIVLCEGLFLGVIQLSHGFFVHTPFVLWWVHPISCEQPGFFPPSPPLWDDLISLLQLSRILFHALLPEPFFHKTSKPVQLSYFSFPWTPPT